MAPRDLAVYRLSIRNVGDRASCPAQYIPELAGFFHADLTVVDLDAFAALRTVIVGGGGLLRPAANGWYADRWRATLDELGGVRRPELLVYWGLGHLDNRGRHLTRSDQCDAGDLVGVRDRIDGVRFVPCASALHPFFDCVPDPTTEVVVFHSADRPFALRGGPAARIMGNTVSDPHVAMAHCAAGELVVTNSYHGWYWATLAGRRVVLVSPQSSKFSALPWAADVAEAEADGTVTWATLHGRGIAHAGALGEARARNQQFADEVLERIAGL